MDNLEPYPDFYKRNEYGEYEKKKSPSCNMKYAKNLICNNNVNLVK